MTGTPKAVQEVVSDLDIKVRWGGKDGKWRWLVDVVDTKSVSRVAGGEELHFDDAIAAAENAAHSIIADL